MEKTSICLEKGKRAEWKNKTVVIGRWIAKGSSVSDGKDSPLMQD